MSRLGSESFSGMPFLGDWAASSAQVTGVGLNITVAIRSS